MPYLFNILIIVQMLEIDIGDHVDHRRQLQEGAVTFIRFRH